MTNWYDYEVKGTENSKQRSKRNEAAADLYGGKFKTLGELRAWERAQARKKRGPTTETARGRRVGVAELGEGFPDLANRFGVDAQDLANANPDTSKVSAGAAYNIPPPPKSGKMAAPAWQEDKKPWWYNLTPWDEDEETFYEWAKPEPGGPGTPEWLVEQVAPIGQWIKNTVTGAMEWIETQEPQQSSSGKAKMASPAAPPTFTSFGTGWDNTYSPGVTPEEMVAGARSERWGQPSLTMRDLVEAENRMDRRPTYEPIPAPAKMGNFEFTGGATLQQGFSEQLKNIYNVEPALRWEKWKSDILGIEAFDREGIDERVANIGYDEWTHQFTENWLYQYASGGEIDWEAVMAVDPNAENLLEALGYFSTPEAEGGVGGYKQGGGRGRRRQPVGYGAGQKPFAQPRNAYLNLTSWSI